MSDTTIISDRLTTREAAAYLKRSLHGLYQLMNRGHIGYFRPGNGKAYFARQDLDAFMNSGRHPSNAELADRADAILNGGTR